MTTITYRDRILAADGASFAGSLRQPGNAIKAVRGKGGVLASACGSAAFCETWMAWVTGGCKGDHPTPGPSSKDDGGDCGILVHPDGRLQMFEADGAWFVDGPYFAIGAGDAVAMGAFWQGATAEEAVRAAIFHDTHTGGEPTVLALDTITGGQGA